ncbi:MAG: hypothetical protein WBA93_18725 [Microcoleaceae cyanobacterium]
MENFASKSLRLERSGKFAQHSVRKAISRVSTASTFRYIVRFIRAYLLNQQNGTGYRIINDGNLVGYGVIKKAKDGFLINPLFAENQEIADKDIFCFMYCTYSENPNVYIDVPDINKQALSLVEGYKMKSIFECVRMYTTEKPNINWRKIFAVTTLELG